MQRRCLLEIMVKMEKMEKGSEYRTFPRPYATVMEAFGFLIEERTDDSIKEHLPMALSFRAEIKDYRQFSKEEFMAAGFDPLYPFVGKDSPAGKKLTAFMEKVGMGEEERNVIGTLVWFNAQESGTKGPLGAIHLFNGLLKGFDQVQEMMGNGE